jgi:L,D-transpeptidase ErfK/SrfK
MTKNRFYFSAALIGLMLSGYALTGFAETTSKPAPKPAVSKKKAAETKKAPAKKGETAEATRPAAGNERMAGVEEVSLSAEEALKVTDSEENESLPEYPLGARIAMGAHKTYQVGEEDTLLDIARHFGIGYVELRAANPDIDPWAPTPGAEVLIPRFQLLPRARQSGIVVNLAKMRLYYFRYPGKEPITHPIGIGQEGLATPTGQTKIVRKTAGPSWYPTPRMREAKPWLPQRIPPGAANPLGTHALYLGWPTFLIHGSNKPWGIGRRVSSGCMRMYPEDIVSLFDQVPTGTPVTVVDQPILVGWLDDGLYLEANPTQTQSIEIENSAEITPKPLNNKMRAMITDAAGVAANHINWSVVEKTIRERRGVPVRIATAKGGKTAAPIDQGRYSYN